MIAPKKNLGETSENNYDTIMVVLKAIKQQMDANERKREKDMVELKREMCKTRRALSLDFDRVEEGDVQIKEVMVVTMRVVKKRSAKRATWKMRMM